MYQFSRAIYRELAPNIAPVQLANDGESSHEAVLHACERAVERLITDHHYFAHPARTLFNDVRFHFPMSAQRRVWLVINRYMDCAKEFVERRPLQGYDINGEPLQCRATTRKGSPCQRMPLPHNGYCPSHQHLAETEEVAGELETIAA